MPIGYVPIHLFWEEVTVCAGPEVSRPLTPLTDDSSRFFIHG